MYKGLKQNEQLKKLLNSAQETIDNSNTLISSQKKLTYKLTEESNAKTVLIDQLKDLNAKENEISEIKISSLESDISYLKSQSKKDNRKNFWKGVKVGGITIGVLGTATVLYLLTN